MYKSLVKEEIGEWLAVLKSKDSTDWMIIVVVYDESKVKTKLLRSSVFDKIKTDFCSKQPDRCDMIYVHTYLLYFRCILHYINFGLSTIQCLKWLAHHLPFCLHVALFASMIVKMSDYLLIIRFLSYCHLKFGEKKPIFSQLPGRNQKGNKH